MGKDRRSPDRASRAMSAVAKHLLGNTPHVTGKLCMLRRNDIPTAGKLVLANHKAKHFETRAKASEKAAKASEKATKASEKKAEEYASIIEDLEEELEDERSINHFESMVITAGEYRNSRK